MKQFLVLLMLLCSTIAFAQDVIVKKDGSTVVCRVVELTSSEIVYKKWSDLNGSNYVMNRTDASAINYENGKKVNLSETTNLYQPHNQNDGVQQYNDRALLAIDKATFYTPQSVKNLRLIGWIGGIAIVGVGVALAAADDDTTPIGLGIAGGGVLFTGGFLLAANHQLNKARQPLYSTLLLKTNFNLPNGSSIALGTDLIRDNTLGQNTLGLGLRYNF
ncbi:MAG: hypothetical protein IJV28_07820 [Paludibacteraceae bacterium]|nr:hypothetical protein [Paludibacteraceae bacterium]